MEKRHITVQGSKKKNKACPQRQVKKNFPKRASAKAHPQNVPGNKRQQILPTKNGSNKALSNEKQP